MVVVSVGAAASAPEQGGKLAEPRRRKRRHDSPSSAAKLPRVDSALSDSNQAKAGSGPGSSKSDSESHASDRAEQGLSTRSDSDTGRKIPVEFRVGFSGADRTKSITFTVLKEFNHSAA